MTVRNDHHSDFEAGQLPLFSRRHLCFWSARGPLSPSVPFRVRSVRRRYLRCLQPLEQNYAVQAMSALP